jgi:hypothetical protein
MRVVRELVFCKKNNIYIYIAISYYEVYLNNEVKNTSYFCKKIIIFLPFALIYLADPQWKRDSESFPSFSV